MWPNIR
nr:unnamed protein product [Callosobruchus analis]